MREDRGFVGGLLVFAGAEEPLCLVESLRRLIFGVTIVGWGLKYAALVVKQARKPGNDEFMNIRA